VVSADQIQQSSSVLDPSGRLLGLLEVQMALFELHEDGAVHDPAFDYRPQLIRSLARIVAIAGVVVPCAGFILWTVFGFFRRHCQVKDDSR